MRILVSLGLVLGLSAGADAQDFIAGAYAASADLCETARRDGVQAMLEEGETVLTAKGLEGIEYHCDFLQVLDDKRVSGWLVTALCEEPGYAFPDLISIVPRGEGELELTSVVSHAGGNNGNSGLYQLCQGVEAP